jgi:hypothetical protein
LSYSPARILTRFVVIAALLASALTWAGVSRTAARAQVTTADGTLDPAPGQFFPVSPVTALDTRDGTGGVSTAPLAAGATATFPVTGIGDVPAGDVSDVLVVITAYGPIAAGGLEAHDPDDSNPGIWTLPMTAGQNRSISNLTRVSSGGTIAVTNDSTGPTDVEVSVMGYVQSADPQTLDTQDPGDTFVGLPYAGILDTRSGFGQVAGPSQIPAGGSITIQVAGIGGVPSDADGAVLYLGTANASQVGWISAYQSDGTDPASPVVSYLPGHIVCNLYYGSLSASGQLTLTNHGSAPVDLMAAVQGYLVNPASAEAGGTYASASPQRIADTRFGTGGVRPRPFRLEARSHSRQLVLTEYRQTACLPWSRAWQRATPPPTACSRSIPQGAPIPGTPGSTSMAATVRITT